MKKIFIIPLLFLCNQLVFSQGGSFTMSYPVSFPMGDLHDYSSEEYYEVVAAKGNKKKTLFYLPDGTLTKVKG